MSPGHAHAPLLSASVRLSVFAFALSSWVEGYSQLRQPVNSVGSIMEPHVSYAFGLEDIDEDSEGTDGSGRFARWLHRRGRRFDDTERTIMGILDVSTALGILHILRNRPMLPFLLAPLLTTIPLPRSSDMRALRWAKVLFTSVALCLCREFERVAVARAVAAWRHHKDLQDGVYLGPVLVRGAKLPYRAPTRNVFDDEEEVDCMICTGQNDMSQSITSLSSQLTGTDMDIPISSSSTSLGPLEAFCTVAPTKHVAHRECFMRWHSVYESQRRSQTPDTVSLLPSFQPPQEDAQQASSARHADLRRARALLRSAGFVYLLASIRPATSPLPSTYMDRGMGMGDRDRPFQPTLTLFPLKPSSESSSRRSSGRSSNRISDNRRPTHDGAVPPTGRLATLRTECPPCPGCRSAVDLHFCPTSSSSRSHSRSSSPPGSRWSSWASMVESGIADFVKEGSSLVTGRTIAVSLSAQLSFLFTMYSMAHARDHASHPPPGKTTLAVDRGMVL